MACSWGCVHAVNVTKADLNLTANVKTMDWAPQADILGHPNVRAFVTQGGINSMYEAMHNAVPVAVIPQIGDQVYNLARVRHLTQGDCKVLHGFHSSCLSLLRFLAALQ